MRRLVSVLAVTAHLVACGGGELDGTPTGDAGTGGAAGTGGVGGASGTAGAAGVSEEDLPDLIRPEKSCAYSCPDVDGCAEQAAPYKCPALGAWDTLLHSTKCEEMTPPQPVKGTCTVSEATGEAARYTGPLPDGGRLLPDGRRVHPAGQSWIWDEKDLPGSLTTYVAMVPGTTLAITVDTGSGPHAIRVSDTAALGAPKGPVVSSLVVDPKATLQSAIGWGKGGLFWVGSAEGKAYALTVDAGGKLARAKDKDLSFPKSPNDDKPYYAASLAVSPDATTMVVCGVTDPAVHVLDVDPSSPSFGAVRGSVDVKGAESFQIAFDPHDPSGKSAWLTQWGYKKLHEIDLSEPTAPKIARTLVTDKAPEGIAFLDARFLAVGNSLGDTISLVDRLTGTVTPVPIELDPNLGGYEPTALAWDGTSQRLYAALAGLNAVAAYDVDLSVVPPVLSLGGRIPSAWWPGGVAVRDDGAVVVASMRGRGEGPTTISWAIGDNDIADRMHGGLQVVPKPSKAELAQGEVTVAQDARVGAQPGQPTVTCPGAYDFPVPTSNTAGPSTKIKRVFFVVRENKGFDGLFGDLSGVEGDPSLTLKTKSSDMDAIWKNLRDLARGFTVADNYHTDAVYSTQGHVWATFGRTNDFNERTWAISGAGHDARAIPGGGIFDVSKPIEGSIFEWLGKQKVGVAILGEIVGGPAAGVFEKSPADPHYPGGPFQNIGYNDLEKACYTAGRARIVCDLPAFVYMTLPNDHTFGASPKNPTPETFCAVNDEATGMVVDAVSHSPYWKESLIVITEDDPSQGGEHIDSHRAPLVLVSPWIRRGYVSKTHLDMASLHKLVMHVFGVPYPSFGIANAALPLDAFTSTPDFSPYSYTPRTRPLECGKKATKAEQALTDSWDLTDVDEQPGLDNQVTRWMRGTAADDALGAAQGRRRAAARLGRRLTMRRWAPVPLLAGISLLAPRARADDEPRRELVLRPLPADRPDDRPTERRFSAERPFVYTEDPTTVAAGGLGVGYTAGFASGTAAERPLPANIGAPGVMHALTISVGATSRVEPFVTARVLEATDRAKTTRAGGGGGLKVQLTRSDARGLRLALVGGVGREAQGAWLGWGRLAVTYDFGALRLAANGHVERAFAAQRDTVDLLVFAGASYRVVEGVRTGIEYVGQDLEDAFEAEEAEGGARHYAGPTLAIGVDHGRVQLVAGPAFGLNRQARGLLGRASVVVQF